MDEQALHDRVAAPTDEADGAATRRRGAATRAAGVDQEVWDRKEAELRSLGVEHCLSAYVDVHGIAKAKAVPIDHFSRMMSGSELYTGAAIEGLGQTPADDELSLWPDVDAITVLPWEPTIAWAPGCLHLHGEPYSMCSRSVLQRQLDRLAERGLVFNLGIETEFFLVRRENGRVVPADPKDVLDRAAYDVTTLLDSYGLVGELVEHMNSLGWDVYSFDHEDANSQFEVDFAYSDAMTTCDRFVLWRMMTKQLARRHGCEATFMPKPYADRTGNGGHFNMSMASADDGENVFDDQTDARGAGISDLAYHFIAGVLRHGAAICAVSAPTVNSYKRLVKAGTMRHQEFTWAPVYVSYGDNNRTHMMRVPMGGGRVESRAVDTSCNPYLTAAMLLAAGLEGIEEQLDPGDPIQLNMYSQSDEQLHELGVGILPRTLLEAADALDADPLAEQVMGPDLKRSYVDLKRAEWWDYHNTISEWEYDRYLEFF